MTPRPDATQLMRDSASTAALPLQVRVDPSPPLVLVGSTNRTKLTAARLAFDEVLPHASWQVEGINAIGGLGDQGLTNEETLRGAFARAQFAAGDPRNPMYGVGIEGGLERINGAWVATSWIVILDRRQEVGIGSTPSIKVPDDFAIRMQQGETLGQVCDDVFGPEAAEREGYYGVMTGNFITRTTSYTFGIGCALARFARPGPFEFECNMGS